MKVLGFIVYRKFVIFYFCYQFCDSFRSFKSPPLEYIKIKGYFKTNFYLNKCLSVYGNIYTSQLVFEDFRNSILHLVFSNSIRHIQYSGLNISLPLVFGNKVLFKFQSSKTVTEKSPKRQKIILIFKF